MCENNELIDWYNQLNEEAVIAKVNVPVIDSPEITNAVADGGSEEPKEVVVKTKESDPVDEKDKDNMMVTFIMTKKLQGLLMRLGGIESPYEDGSVERQNTVDEIKNLYELLGEKISKL